MHFVSLSRTLDSIFSLLFLGAEQSTSLSLLSDVKNFEVDLPNKLVWIESERDANFLLETLKKCGKEVKYKGTN